MNIKDYQGNSIAVSIDGVHPNDAMKLNSRAVITAIDDFKKSAKVAYANAKGKKTIPAVKKELKMLGATQYYARWQSDSSSYTDDSVKIWFN